MFAYLDGKLDDSLSQSAIALADIEELGAGQAEVFRALVTLKKRIERLKRGMQVIWNLINRVEDSRAGPNDSLPVDTPTFFAFSSAYYPLLP